MKALVLGVGMQGKAALTDLVQSGKAELVIAADADIEGLEAFVSSRGWQERVVCRQVDAADPASLDEVFSLGPEVAIDLLPHAYVGRVARAAVERGVHLVNTVYVPAELRALDQAARRRGVIILPEFGLDPGIDLVMLGEAARRLAVIEAIYSYGAGIPEPAAADNPLGYKVSWTFQGVLESYRRPARLIHEGTVQEIPPNNLFDPEQVHWVEVAGLGTLEAYPNGDAVQYVEALGLDVAKLHASGRYTMRWPGHCAFWRNIVDLHLLDAEPVLLDGVVVDRVRFLAAAMEPHLQYAPGERDVVVVRVEVIGWEGERRKRLRYEVVDRLDLASGLSAMSRTVGFTASIGAQLIGEGTITGPGLKSPLRDVPYEKLLAQLGKRGILHQVEEMDL